MQGERLAARFGVWHIAADAPEPVLKRRLLAARGAQDGCTDDTADVTRHRLAVFAEMTRSLSATTRTGASL